MIYPLDPNCPVVIKQSAFYEDPITIDSGCADEFREDFERKHSKTCERCRAYGLDNIEV